MKVLITGGHITPALAVAEELLENKGIEIIFVGRKFAVSSDKSVSFEYKALKKACIPFIDLPAGRLSRSINIEALIDLCKIPYGILKSFRILQKTKPDIIMSFGGYIALPISTLAYLMGIPVYIHEQTIAPGLGNRIIGIFASKVFIAFEEAAHYFNSSKVVITGNPIRQSIYIVQKKPFNIGNIDRPVVYVTGGSLGSHAINNLIEQILPELLNSYIVIHQTGSIKKYGDFERLSKIKHKNYFVIKHVSGDEIGYVYRVADLVIARAGANTLFELIALNKPSILIPLPWSGYNEQEKHAVFMKENNVSEVFRQDRKANILLEMISGVLAKQALYKKNFVRVNKYHKKDAASRIAKQILPRP